MLDLYAEFLRHRSSPPIAVEVLPVSAKSMPSNRTFVGNPRMSADTFAASRKALCSIP